MKAFRGRLRPYHQPPYKFKKSHYEVRMRGLREKIRLQALKLAAVLREISENDPDLPAMLNWLSKEDYSDQLHYIYSAIDEMLISAKTLEPDAITRVRTERLGELRNMLFDVIDRYSLNHHKSQLSSFIDDEFEEEVPDEVDPPTEEDFREANIAKNCIAETIENLALPFWPREKPPAGPSKYEQKNYDPKTVKAGVKFEEVLQKEDTEREARKARDLAKALKRMQRRKARMTEEKAKREQEAKDKEEQGNSEATPAPRKLIIRRAGYFHKNKLPLLIAKRIPRPPSPPIMRRKAPKRAPPKIPVHQLKRKRDSPCKDGERSVVTESPASEGSQRENAEKIVVEITKKAEHDVEERSG